MKDFELSVFYARSKVNNFIQKRIEFGYKESTVNIDKKNITRFLNYYDDNQIINEDIIIDFINNRYLKDSRFNYAYIRAVKKTLVVFLKFIDDGIIYVPHIKSDVISSDSNILIFNKYIQKTCINNSNYTINFKKKTILSFLNRMDELDVSIEDITSEIIVEYCKSLSIESKYIVKSFLKYLFIEGMIESDLSLFIYIEKRKIRIPSVYSNDEIKKILNYYPTNTLIGIRNAAIILLICSTGLRSCDIVNIKYNNFDFANHRLNIVQVKTRVPISFPISSEIEEIIIKYHSASEGINKSDYLFTSVVFPYSQLSTASIRCMIRKAIIDLNLFKEGRKTGSHSLRSSFATSLANDDVSYGVIEKLLGHQNDESIKSYVLNDINKLRLCALPTFQPIGRFQKWLEV